MVQVDESNLADTSMMANLRFEIAADLPALDDDAAVFVMEPGEPDRDEVDKLLSIFGIEVPLESDGAGGYTSYSGDMMEPSFFVASDALKSWNYTAPISPTSIDPACIDAEGFEPVAPPTPVNDTVEVADTDPPSTEVGTAPGGEVEGTGGEEIAVDPCPDSGEPEDPPTEDEALQMFSDLMSDIGVDIGSLDLEIFSDGYGSVVSGYLRVGGVRSPLSWIVSYGEAGRIIWASGVLGDPERLADYGRIGTVAGVERLNSEQASMFGALDPAAASSAPSGAISVEIVDVEEELVMLFGIDDVVYLVPGYAYIAEPDEMGYDPRYTIWAVADEYIEMVTESPGTDAPSDGDEPISGTPSPGEPGEDQGMGDGSMEEITTEEANTLLGMSEAEAASTAEANGWVVRIAERDGEQFALTMDYNWQRVNLTIKDGVVTYVFIG